MIRHVVKFVLQISELSHETIVKIGLIRKATIWPPLHKNLLLLIQFC